VTQMALREWFEVNDKRYRVRLRRLQGVMPSAYPSKYSSFDTTDSETAQHSTVQYSIAQYSTVQHSTAQHLYVTCHIAQLLLDLTHCLEVRGAVEGISPQHEELYQVLRDVPPSHIKSSYKVLGDEPIVDGDYMSDTVSSIDHHTSHQAL
jgi:hypothetical protein